MYKAVSDPTTCQCLMLLLQGQVLIKGKARKGLLADDKDLASQLKVGMVFQNGALFDSLNVRENVGFMLYEHSNLPKDRIEVRVVRKYYCLIPSAAQHMLALSRVAEAVVQSGLASTCFAHQSVHGQGQMLNHEINYVYQRNLRVLLQHQVLEQHL